MLDVAFPDAKVAVEVDGKDHARPDRKARDEVRDAWLVGQGWRIVRITNENVRRPRFLVDVLKEMIPDFKIARPLPVEPFRPGPKNRVVIRDAEHPTGVERYEQQAVIDGPAVQRRRHRLPSSAVR